MAPLQYKYRGLYMTHMGRNRLEAFSDGVIAIIITIMVLELKAPHATELAALKGLVPVFLSYVLSFLYIAIYWNNHHHMLHTVTNVNGLILWSNTHLLFWLSLIPFATAWMGENHFAPVPTAVYGWVLLMCAIAYFAMQQAIIKSQGSQSPLAKAVGRDCKGKISPILYVAGIFLAFIHPMFSQIIYVLVALIWFVPDKRIEKLL
jgi:uncharacterized membrane protein